MAEELIINCETGETEIKAIEQPNPNISALSSFVRQERNRLLSECDWTQLPDSPLTETQREQYRVYRQALRDITEQEGFPINVRFPTLFEEG